MNDLTIQAEEQLSYEIAQRASEIGACDRWAHIRHDIDGPDRDPMLWPRDRGEIHGVGYRASARTVRRGLWQVCLAPRSAVLALGVHPDTQSAALRVHYGAPAGLLTPRQVDEIIQVGLFGGVLYR